MSAIVIPSHPDAYIIVKRDLNDQPCPSNLLNLTKSGRKKALKLHSAGFGFLPSFVPPLFIQGLICIYGTREREEDGGMTGAALSRAVR